MTKLKPKSVSDKIREAESLRLERSMTASENLARRMECYGNSAVEAVAAREPGSVDSASALRYHFYAKRDLYYRSTSFSCYSKKQASMKLWQRVAAKQSESGTDPETFIEAQFVFFSKVFKTAPTIKHLLTANAVLRAQHYSLDREGFTERAYKPSNLERVELLKELDSQIRLMCSEHNCSRKEFYKRFVLTGFYQLPEMFTDLDPEFEEAKQDGKKQDDGA